MSKKGSFIIALICCANSLFAQNISVEKEQNSEKKDSLIMNAFEWYQEAFPDQNIDQTQFLELLDNFIQKPISINDKHIKDCILLNEIQVISILKYREENGNIVSWNELAKIESFTPELVHQLKPYLSLAEPTSSKLNRSYFKASSSFNYISRLKTFLPISKGYIADDTNENAVANYEGSPYRIYNRAKISYNQNISAGVLMEKDAGERKFNDLLSSHLAFKIPGRNNFKLIIGDYHVNLGQHLLVSTNGFASRGVGIYSFFSGGRELSPNFSVNENSFLRGIATKWRNRNWQVLTFASNRKIDGSSKDLPTPLTLTGLHRTKNETEKHNTTQSSIQGLALTHDVGTSSYQFNLVQYRFGQTTPATVDTSEIGYSFNFKQQIGKGLLFGEIQSKAHARDKINLIVGGLIPLNKNVSIGAQYRNISDKPIIYGLPQTRSSILPETGLRLGFEYRPSKQWILNVWTDQFVLKPNDENDLKRSEFEAIAMLNWNPSKKHKHYIRLRHRVYENQVSNDAAYLKTSFVSKLMQFRIHSDNTLSKKVSLRNRLEVLSDEKVNALKGFLVFTDLAYQMERGKLTARVAYFNIDEYQYRVYTYEHDVLYSFKIPAYYGVGWRTYVLYKHKIGKHLKAETVVGYKLQKDRQTIGSGNDLVGKNYRWDITVQLIANF